MRILATICLLFFAINCQSQNVSLKFSFLSLVDEPSFPTIQSGIEFKLSKKIGWYNEVGIKYHKSYFEMADTNFTNSRGFKLKTEIRYYFTTNDEIYIGCNGFYTKDFHNAEALYYYSNDSSMLMVDNFAAEKKVWGLNLIIGKEYPKWKRIYCDLYAGLGIRFISIDQSNMEVDHKRDVLQYGSHHPNIPDNRIWMDVKGGRSVLPNFSMGVRICYSFK
jgi:hypothetical protein